MKTQQEYIDQGEQYILKTYNRFPVVLEKGEGVYLYDADQKKYLDFGAGIAVFALGYGNEAYNQALKDQIDKLIHTSNLYYNIPAVEAAKENAELNNLDNCTFWAGDVLKVIDELGEVPDLIMLDPPRDGVNPKALMKILNFGVERLVYIACKPTSLARDLEMIQGRGYKVEKISGVDLFPGTYHVETVCLLSRKDK